jgi:hypothetical protein
MKARLWNNITGWSMYLTHWISWSILTRKFAATAAVVLTSSQMSLPKSAPLTHPLRIWITSSRQSWHRLERAHVGIGTVGGSFHDVPFIIGVPIEPSSDIQWQCRKPEFAVKMMTGGKGTPPHLRHKYRKIQNVQMKDETGQLGEKRVPES